MINVLIVDDSSVMRHIIKNVVTEDNKINVMASASNGKEAVKATHEHSPDVILMDLFMGQFDGVTAIKEIMNECPTPIIILSSIGNTSMNEVFNGLDAGAIDYVNKPAKNQSNIRSISNQLITKIYSASRSNIKSLIDRKKNKNTEKHTFDQKLNYDVILLGSSTGGPTALEEILSNFPVNLPISVIICQHMPDSFIPAFSKRLQNLSNRDVEIARHGLELKQGFIYILPSTHNTIIKKVNNSIIFNKSNKSYEAYNNPSIDALFTSASIIFENRIIASILTGMGKDGGNGLLSIKNKGGLTITQNKETCVVYGMPKFANDIGASQRELKLNQIAPFIVSAVV